jgi:hypothetical protein
LAGGTCDRALGLPAPSPDQNARPEWRMILKMSGAIQSSLIQSKSGRRPDRWLAAPAGSSRRSILNYREARESRWPYPGGRNTRGSSWGSGFGRKAAVAAWTSAPPGSVPSLSEFPGVRVSGIRVQSKIRCCSGSRLKIEDRRSTIEEVLGGGRGRCRLREGKKAKAGRRRQGSAAGGKETGGKGTRLLGRRGGPIGG